MIASSSDAGGLARRRFVLISRECASELAEIRLDQSSCTWNRNVTYFFDSGKSGWRITFRSFTEHLGDAQYGYAYSSAGEQDSWRQLPDRGANARGSVHPRRFQRSASTHCANRGGVRE